jgi:PEP-CTERM motif
MSRHRAAKAASVLLACAAFAIGMANCAQASTVVDWSGQDSFTADRITFTGFTANQLSSIAGDGTYTSSSYFNYFTWSQVPVNTTFDLELRLNGTWTTVSTWTLDSLNNVKLSTLTTPINFATSTVSGIELTATPDYYGNNYNDMNLSLFQDCGRDVEQETFTFNNVSTTPLPATLPLFAGGLGFVGYLARRRKGSTKQALATA